MSLNIRIDKHSDTPLYQQIIGQITSMIKNGQLKAGDRLPPERELANSMNISRGTIKKAYEELERDKVIVVTQGSGSYVSREQDVIEEGRKEKAIKLIDELLDNLEGLKFSYREISTFITIKLMEREKLQNSVRVAAVDCNPEALSIFKKQLSYISNVELKKYLLDEVKSRISPEDTFKAYDLILTTSTHFRELQELLPGSREKIVQAALSPSQQTIIDMAKISSTASIGILCSSRQFLDIILNRLHSFSVDLKHIRYEFEDDNPDLEAFLENTQVLIVPPDFFIGKGERCISAISAFKENGGRIIRFDYQIERGSLIYIEEQISKIMDKK